MKTSPFQLVVGFLGSLAFMGFGVWILLWCADMIATALDSPGWPTTQGRVLESQLEDRGEPTPKVVYEYAVDGRIYQSSQLGFDIFDKPGGRGRAASRVERYPNGAQVTVYYDAGHPACAILEPGDVSPFTMPIAFGLLFVVLGMVMARSTLRYARGRLEPLPAAKRQRVVLISTSALFYLLLVAVSFESGVQEVHKKALGDFDPWGLSPTAFFLLLQTLLFIPVPWFLKHMLEVIEPPAGKGPPKVGLLSLFRALWAARRRGVGPARSAAIVLAGMLYFVLLVVLWIAFAAVRGL